MNSSVDGRILRAISKCWVSLVFLAAACSEGADSPTPDPAGDDATRDAGSLPSSIGGDGDGMMDDGLAGMGGEGGSDAPAGTGGSGGTSPGDGPAECVLNEGERADACPMICRETCNGSDDDCDGRVDEGEAALECDVPNAEGACTRGACLIAECEGAYRDCDGEVENGCETSIESIDDCGLCGNRCDFPGALMACTDGRCEAIGCVDDLGDCDDNVGDCETAINTLSNCGQCGQPCSELPNAEQTCETGSCEVASCTEGFADCNVMAGDGCEQPLNTAEHCSSCGMACDLPGSTDDDCSSGDTCLAGTCDEGWDECRGGRADGCEPLDTDTDCGECDRGCDATLERVVAAACDAGSCVIAECEDLFGDCDSDRFNGCETPTNTLERCGACDTPCAIPNAEVSCETGTWTCVACEPGWLDCRGGLADGRGTAS
ncbi:MAG: hypothetical protein OXT09_25945, partial [Myxococcales bacterium]|nr:hypothetical protein [Myxococcales bacterium]